MKINVTGIIIKEMDLSDSDKLVNILTSEKGIVSAIAKRSKTFRNRLGGMIQLFAYGEFALYTAKNGYILSGCEIKELFLGLRSDLEALALSEYFCQLCLSLRPEAAISNEFLRVFLNSLFFMVNRKMDIKILKSIFELRACSLCGYMPKLVSCERCGSFENDSMNFSLEKAKLFCSRCVNANDFAFPISGSLLFLLRYIVYSELEKLFNFSVSPKIANQLSSLTEKYVMIHVSDNFKSLLFYKKIAGSFKS